MSVSGIVSEQRAKKSLGQHFLRDQSVLERIAGLLNVREGDQVVEIGPGPGALTALLRPLPWSRLLLLEKDDHYAKGHASSPMPGLEIHHGDALDFPWQALEGPWKIAGNLPYNIASPLMWEIVCRVPVLERAVFMLQKEVAERLLSPPGSRQYGALSVWIQSFCEPSKGFLVPPSCFSPPPKVDSEIVIFSPLTSHTIPKRPDHLSSLLKLCFQQRRKQMQSILRRAFPEALVMTALESESIAPSLRPESLTPDQFQRLAAKLFS